MRPSEFIEDREVESKKEGYELRLKWGTLRDLDKDFISKAQHEKELFVKDAVIVLLKKEVENLKEKLQLEIQAHEKTIGDI